jgi:hypothetical protein
METDRLDALRPAGVLRPQVLVEIQQRPPLEDPAPAGCNTRIADPPIVRAAVSRRPYRSWPAVSGRVARTCRPDARSRRRCPSPRRCTASRCGLPSRTPPATPHRTGSASRPGAPGQPGRSGRAAAARYGIGHRPTIRHPAGSSRHLARDAERARVGNQLAGPPARPALTNRSSCLWIAATGEVPRAGGQLVAGNLLPGGRPQGRRRCAWACRQCARVDLLGAQPVGTTRRRSSIRPRAVHAARICRRSSAALSTVVTPRRTHTGPRAQSCRK